MLTHDEKRELLGIAREAITKTLQGKEYVFRAPLSAGLLQPAGVFVTIRMDHELRGCIGYIESNRPLAELVADVAVKAACEDPRFSPLTLPELHQTHLEISILSPLRAITRAEEIEVGVHGLLLELGMRRGLLLPQVAVEHHWDRIQFLEALSRKAGLDRYAWEDPEAHLCVFTADVIEEESVLDGEGRP